MSAHMPTRRVVEDMAALYAELYGPGATQEVLGQPVDEDVHIWGGKNPPSDTATASGLATSPGKTKKMKKKMRTQALVVAGEDAVHDSSDDQSELNETGMMPMLSRLTLQSSGRVFLVIGAVLVVYDHLNFDMCGRLGLLCG